MADVYSSEEALVRDYGKLNQVYQNKAGKYIKNLLRIQRMEDGVSAQLFKLERPQVLNLKKEPKTYYCSFCGKSHYDAFRMIAGPHDVFICDECARLCGEILDEAEAEGAEDGEGEKGGHAEVGEAEQQESKA